MAVHILTTTDEGGETGAVFRDGATGVVFGPVWESREPAEAFLAALAIISPTEVLTGWVVRQFLMRGDHAC